MVAEGVRTTRIVRVLAEREALHKTTIDLLGDSWLEKRVANGLATSRCKTHWVRPDFAEIVRP